MKLPETIYATEKARENVVDYIMKMMDEYRGHGIYTLVIAGRQGVGKSRLMSLLALQLTKRGFDVYYDAILNIHRLRNKKYDYVILDEIAAWIHSTEWQTKEARSLYKMEILIRDLARYGYVLAAPRDVDVLKRMRSYAHKLYLLTPEEARRLFDTACGNVTGVYVPHDLSHIAFALGQLYYQNKAMTFCISWEELKAYGLYSEEWQKIYDRVQKKREMLMRRAAMELEKTGDVDALLTLDFDKLPRKGEYYVITREILRQYNIDMPLTKVAHILGGQYKSAIKVNGKYVRCVLVKK
ncbi:MAG: hypothetical protein QXT13_09680 [Pyrobaculum sp.]